MSDRNKIKITLYERFKTPYKYGMVVKMGSLWVMNLFAYKGGSASAYDTFAVSKDLVRWTMWNGEPTVHSSEEYDMQHVHKPWVKSITD